MLLAGVLANQQAAAFLRQRVVELRAANVNTQDAQSYTLSPLFT